MCDVCVNLFEDHLTGDEICLTCGYVKRDPILSENYYSENEICFKNRYGDEEFHSKDSAEILNLKNMCDSRNLKDDVKLEAIRLYKENNSNVNKLHLSIACMMAASQWHNYSLELFEDLKQSKDYKNIDAIFCRITNKIKYDFNYFLNNFEIFFKNFKAKYKCDRSVFRDVINDVLNLKKLRQNANRDNKNLFAYCFVKNKQIKNIFQVEKEVCKMIGLKYNKKIFQK